MRIAYLLTSSLESPYGLGRCFPWARQLAVMGHEVHIVALHHDLGSATSRHFQQAGVWIHYAGQMHVRKVSDTTLYFNAPHLLRVVLSGTLGLVSQAIKIGADVYHIGKPHPQNGTAGLLAARWPGERRLFLDCDDLEVRVNRFGGTWQQRGIAWLEDRLPAWVDGVTVHSRFLESRIQTLGVPQERILRLPSGIDPERFRPIPPALGARWRQRLGLQDRRAITYVGTMSLVNHPVDLLLEAFAKLVPGIEDVVLMLVGGGADLPDLESLAGQLGIAERCRFVGRVEPNAVPALLSLSYVTVDPVHDDLVARARWPLKIVESMAARVPVVTGNVGDRWEMLGKGAAGLVVEPGSSEALADGLETILKDSFLHKQLVRGCRTQAAQYNVADLAQSLVAFYEQVTGK